MTPLLFAALRSSGVVIWDKEYPDSNDAGVVGLSSVSLRCRCMVVRNIDLPLLEVVSSPRCGFARRLGTRLSRAPARSPISLLTDTLGLTAAKEHGMTDRQRINQRINHNKETKTKAKTCVQKAKDLTCSWGNLALADRCRRSSS